MLIIYNVNYLMCVFEAEEQFNHYKLVVIFCIYFNILFILKTNIVYFFNNYILSCRVYKGKKQFDRDKLVYCISVYF